MIKFSKSTKIKSYLENKVGTNVSHATYFVFCQRKQHMMDIRNSQPSRPKALSDSGCSSGKSYIRRIRQHIAFGTDHDLSFIESVTSTARHVHQRPRRDFQIRRKRRWMIDNVPTTHELNPSVLATLCPHRRLGLRVTTEFNHDIRMNCWWRQRWFSTFVSKDYNKLR